MLPLFRILFCFQLNVVVCSLLISFIIFVNANTLHENSAVVVQPNSGKGPSMAYVASIATALAALLALDCGHFATSQDVPKLMRLIVFHHD